MDKVTLPEISLEKIDGKSLGMGLVRIGSDDHAETNPYNPANPQNWTYYYDFKHFGADTSNAHPSSFTPLLKNYGTGGVSETQCLTYYGNYEAYSDHIAVVPTGRVIASSMIHVNNKFTICLKTKFANISNIQNNALILGHDTPRTRPYSFGIYDTNSYFSKFMNGIYKELPGNIWMEDYQNKMLYIILMYEEGQAQAFIFTEDNLINPVVAYKETITPNLLSVLSKDETAKIGIWTGDGIAGSADVYKFAWTNEYGNLSTEQIQEVVRELAMS